MQSTALAISLVPLLLCGLSNGQPQQPPVLANGSSSDAPITATEALLPLLQGVMGVAATPMALVTQWCPPWLLRHPLLGPLVYALSMALMAAVPLLLSQAYRRVNRTLYTTVTIKSGSQAFQWSAGEE